MYLISHDLRKYIKSTSLSNSIYCVRHYQLLQDKVELIFYNYFAKLFLVCSMFEIVFSRNVFQIIFLLLIIQL